MNSIPKTKLTASFQDSAMYQASFSHVKRNDCDKAVPSFEKYLKQFPNGFFSVESSFYLANCALEQKKNTLALEHYEKVIEKSPNPYTERALVHASNMHYDNKDYEKALQRYIQLEESAMISTHVNLAGIGQMRCYYYLKEYELCINKANEVLEYGNLLGDIKTEAYYYMGRSCVEMKNFSLAKTYLKKVYESNQGDMGAEAKYDYIYILFVEENYDLAITEIVDLKQNFSGADFFVAKAYLLLSDIFVKTGDLFQAKHTLNSIIRNYKGNTAITEEAEEKLREIERLEKQIESDSTEPFKTIEIESQIIK
jgi:tetratricopeptide (TPR) repeat protein